MDVYGSLLLLLTHFSLMIRIAAHVMCVDLVLYTSSLSASRIARACDTIYDRGCQYTIVAAPKPFSRNRSRREESIKLAVFAKILNGRLCRK